MCEYPTTRRFFKRFDAAHHDIVVWMREGEKAYADTVGSYISRNDKILKVGEVLIADGHKMNFMVINPATGKPCRFTLIGWEDWASRMFMGFEIMLEENTQASRKAHSYCACGASPTARQPRTFRRRARTIGTYRQQPCPYSAGAARL